MLSTDRIVALGITLLSFTIASFSYRTLLQLEKPNSMILSALSLGEREFDLLNGADCVGMIRSEVVDSDGLNASISGSIRIGINKSYEKAEVMAHAEFNPLGQMVQSSVAFKFAESLINLTTKGTNPIVLHVSSNLSSGGISQEFSFAGPILLKRQSSNDYAIEYAAMTRAKHGYLDALTHPALEKFRAINLTLAPRESVNKLEPALSAKCSAESTAAVDLTSVVNIFESALRGSLLEKFNPASKVEDSGGSIK